MQPGSKRVLLAEKASGEAMPGKITSRTADNKARLHKGQLNELYKQRQMKLMAQDYASREHGLVWDSLSEEEIEEQEDILRRVMADIKGMALSGFQDEAIKQTIFETWKRIVDPSVINKFRRVN